MLALNMLFVFWGLGNAQNIEIRRSHAIAKHSGDLQPVQAVGTLNVIAIMVEFQPDSNRLTSGTGVFGEGGLPYLENNPPVIEPLPHDRSYFEAHLEFAKNYYEKASDGQLSINYRVLPEVYRLPKKMEEYSPVGETFTYKKLAELSRDAWALVEAGGGFDASGLDPENTAFIIFHAGVGRDIELIGTNLDITPYDIPSIYLSKNNLSNLLDDPAFDGFEINGGTFRITNSMILPRTESRRGLDIQDDEFVFPLSINGLLVASIGSHLGLPDLFNSVTGDPAIGRFGLMDGAGFFAYNGLLPPEPSAWEKIYLGWQTPFLIDTNDDEITLPAASLDQPSGIAKYELSSTEYFLVENRHRDVDGTGITLTIRKPDDSEVQQTFTNSDIDFIDLAADIDTLLEAGVLINADNFEFSLPGGLDIGEDEKEGTDDDRFLNGGILIWHIDEAKIQAGLTSGGVNADPAHRGVDLEEADGAQDIGAGIPGALNNSAAFGTAFDFWWSGNNYHVISESGGSTQLYQNRFGPDTTPDNSSNSGSPSYFEFYDFSENLPVASFKIRSADLQDDGISLISSAQSQFDSTYYTYDDEYWNYFPLSLKIAEFLNDTLLVIPTNSGIQIGGISPVSFGGKISFGGTTTQPIPISPNYLVFSNLSSLTAAVIALDSSGLGWPGWSVDVPLSTGFISSQDGETVDIDFTTTSMQGTTGAEVQNNSGFEFRSEIVNGKFVGINDNIVTFVGENIPNYISIAENRLFAGTIATNAGNRYYLFEDGAFTLVDPALDNPFIPLFEESEAEWPAIAENGNFYRVNRTSNRIEGFNKNGATLNHTPIYAPDNIQFIGTPLIADITGDNIQDILVVGQNDYSVNIFAYRTSGEPIQGFPLYVGGSAGKNIQPIHPAFYGDELYAISHTGDLKAWKFENFTSAEWPTRYGANNYNKVSAFVNFENEHEINFTVLNQAETYNWPNPANDVTNIRFQVAPPGGRVEIKVINMSGRIIYEKDVSALGGAPQEVQVNTSGWGSGGYVALVKATVEGKTETKLIKIGVIH